MNWGDERNKKGTVHWLLLVRIILAIVCRTWYLRTGDRTTWSRWPASGSLLIQRTLCLEVRVMLCAIFVFDVGSLFWQSVLSADIDEGHTLLLIRYSWYKRLNCISVVHILLWGWIIRCFWLNSCLLEENFIRWMIIKWVGLRIGENITKQLL